MAKNIYDHLEGLTGQRASINFDKLAKAYESAMSNQRVSDEQKQLDYYQKRSTNERNSDLLKLKISKSIESEIDNVDGNFPIISVFDAYQVVKKASKKYPRDMGIRRLSMHLEKKWECNRTANLTVYDVIKLKDHYSKSYPRSKASSIIDDAEKCGYSTLPVGKLTSIASCIRSQDDYEYYIIKAGLSGNNPYQKKARNFILALVNGEIEKQSQLDPRQLDDQSKQLWEQEGPYGDPNLLVNEFEQYQEMTNAPIPDPSVDPGLESQEEDSSEVDKAKQYALEMLKR